LLGKKGKSQMTLEKQKVEELFATLCTEPLHQFPPERQLLDAPSKPGVYIIRKGETVLHVGRTIRLHQRLKNHLHGSSSFTNKYLKGEGAILRKGHTYRFIVVRHKRLRSLLEAHAIGMLCPKHIGLGQ
jgi:excinuclease UvrABC nuclease subunit